MTDGYVYFVYDKQDSWASCEFKTKKELEDYLSSSDFIGQDVEGTVVVYCGKRVEVKYTSKVVVGEPK